MRATFLYYLSVFCLAGGYFLLVHYYYYYYYNHCVGVDQSNTKFLPACAPCQAVGSLNQESPQCKVETTVDKEKGKVLSLRGLLESGYRFMNAHLTEYDPQLAERFRGLVARKAPPSDPELVELAKTMIDPPSGHMSKFSRPLVLTPQAAEVKTLQNNRVGGFFIEVGALDGERSSNTVWLETKLNWTGLLIEMDPFFYTQLRGKNRRAYGINACLSPQSYPVEAKYKQSSGGHGRVMSSETSGSDIRTISCFPLETLLTALSRRHVDFFSLDVEGLEMPILQTFPWESITVQSVAVEYSHGNKEQLRTFFEGKGYRTVKDIHYADESSALYVDDFIFDKIKRS